MKAKSDSILRTALRLGAAAQHQEMVVQQINIADSQWLPCKITKSKIYEGYLSLTYNDGKKCKITQSEISDFVKADDPEIWRACLTTDDDEMPGEQPRRSFDCAIFERDWFDVNWAKSFVVFKKMASRE